MALKVLSAAQSPTGWPKRLPAQFPPLTGQTGALPGVRSGDLLPWGFKIRGVNLVPSIADQASATGGTAVPATVWTEHWDVWDIAWVRNELDHAVELGCNTVRTQGTIWGVYSGRLTRAEYLGKWTQLSEECQARGLYLYACGGDGGPNDRIADVPNANIQAELVALVTHLDTLPDIIGVDLLQECQAMNNGQISKDIYDACKLISDLPLTWSTTFQPDSQYADPAIWADRADFLDYHAYYSLNSTHLDYYYTNGGTRPVVIGEFGAPTSVPATAVAQLANDTTFINGRHSGGHRNTTGGLQWAIRAIDTSPVLFGIWDYNDVEVPILSAANRAVSRT